MSASRLRRAARATLAATGTLGLGIALVVGLAAPGAASAATPPAGSPPPGGGQGGTASAGDVPTTDPTQATTPEEAAGTGNGTPAPGDEPAQIATDPTDGSTPASGVQEAAPPADSGPKATFGAATITPGDDVVAVAGGHSLRIDWSSLIGNDTNSSGLAILPAGHSWPSHGAASVFATLDTSDRYITYTPDAGFTGNDSFQYQTTDAQGNVGTASGIVIVHVYAQTAPVVKDDSYTAHSYHSIEISGKGLTMNDTDADGDALTVKLLPAYAPKHGTVKLAPGAAGGFSYTPTPGYVGTDQFSYQALDGHGGSSSLATAVITVLDELHASGSPVITGKPAVSSWLTVTPPTITPSSATLSYQWYRGAVAIPGATQANYSVHEADVGSALKVQLLVSKPGMQSILLSTVPTPVVVRLFDATASPTITGSATVGSTLVAKSTGWSPTPAAVSYQWMRNGVAITGATGSTHELSVYDQGWKISVAMTATKPGYFPVTTASGATVVVEAGKLSATPVPTVSGTAKVGQKLTAAAGTWGPAPVTLTYVWKRGGVAITGATSTSYTLRAADLGTTITVTVTGSKGGYLSVSKSSAATSPVAQGTLTATPVPTISGTAQVGKKLTAVAGVWGPSSVKLSYTWKRGGVAIAGATSSSYTPVAADQGKTVTVTVTGSAPGYVSVSKTSAVTSVIVAK